MKLREGFSTFLAKEGLAASLLFFLIHCGSTTDTQQNVDDSISIPDGYAVYGTVNERSVQVVETDTGSAIYGEGNNGDQILDSDELVHLDFFAVDSDHLEIVLYIALEDSLAYYK